MKIIRYMGPVPPLHMEGNLPTDCPIDISRIYRRMFHLSFFGHLYTEPQDECIETVIRLPPRVRTTGVIPVPILDALAAYGSTLMAIDTETGYPMRIKPANLRTGRSCHNPKCFNPSHFVFYHEDGYFGLAIDDFPLNGRYSEFHHGVFPFPLSMITNVLLNSDPVPEVRVEAFLRFMEFHMITKHRALGLTPKLMRMPHNFDEMKPRSEAAFLVPPMYAKAVTHTRTNVGNLWAVRFNQYVSALILGYKPLGVTYYGSQVTTFERKGGKPLGALNMNPLSWRFEHPMYHMGVCNFLDLPRFWSRHLTLNPPTSMEEFKSNIIECSSINFPDEGRFSSSRARKKVPLDTEN